MNFSKLKQMLHQKKMEKINALLAFTDEAKEAKIKSDLTGFCRLLNQTISKAMQVGCIIGQPTHEIITGLIDFDPQPMKEALQSKFTDEAKGNGVFGVSAMREELQLRLSECDKITSELETECERNRLSLGLLPYNQGVRLATITLQGDIVAFDENAVHSLCTEIVERNAVSGAYLQRAKSLFAEIREFERITESLSNGQICGVCEIGEKRGVIERLDNGTFELDLTRFVELDFKRANLDEISKSEIPQVLKSE